MSISEPWTGGYVAELPYTFGFYRELTPALMQFALGVKGHAVGGLAQAAFTYCELGSGQGVSASVLAAANPTVEFHATDFNPAHTLHARRMAEAGGLSNVTFYDDSFEEFLARDLPQFDVIALHGVYSWISPEARREVVAFIRRKLKVGGVLYISYNCLPGWSAFLPLRELMVAHAAGSKNPMVARIEAAMAFANSLESAKAAYFTVQPTAKARLEQLADMPRNYLAHEYFNRDWHPMYFADAVRELGEAKVNFVCSAHLTDHVDAVNLTPEQQTLLNEVTDPTQRETVRDYITNEQFRRDIFVRGPLRLDPSEQVAQLFSMSVALSALPSDVPRTASGKLGAAGLQAEVYEPLIAALGAGPQTIRALHDRPEIKALGLARFWQALTILIGGKSIEPSMDLGETIGAQRKQSTERFNMSLMERARSNGDITVLASPITNGAVQADRFEMLFLLAHKLNRPDAAEFAFGQLSERGQRVFRDGKLLETPEENLAELKERLQAFTNKRLPVLKQLGVA